MVFYGQATSLQWARLQEEVTARHATRRGIKKNTAMDDRVALRLSRLPSSIGTISRLAYSRAKAKGVPVEPLLEASNLTAHPLNDPRIRLRVRDETSS